MRAMRHAPSQYRIGPAIRHIMGREVPLITLASFGWSGKLPPTIWSAMTCPPRRNTRQVRNLSYDNWAPRADFGQRRMRRAGRVIWPESGRKHRTCTAQTGRIRGTYGAHSRAQMARPCGSNGPDVASATSCSAVKLRVHLPIKMSFGAWGRPLHRRTGPPNFMHWRGHYEGTWPPSTSAGVNVMITVKRAKSALLYCPRSLATLTRSASEGVNHSLASASG